jgi:hypothetical protein
MSPFVCYPRNGEPCIDDVPLDASVRLASLSALSAVDTYVRWLTGIDRERWGIVSGLTELTAQNFKGPEYHGDHITCDLPRKGDRVWVRSRKRGYFQFRKPVEGNATVKLHWHYDGCMSTWRWMTVLMRS